jgi:transcriptional regulator with XRE-family HTH domain
MLSVSRYSDVRLSDSQLRQIPPMASSKNKRRSDFGRRLFEAREAKGLTQMQASAALQIRQSTLSEAETQGEGSAYVVHMAKLYGCDPYWLAMGEGSPYPAAKQFSAQAAALATAFDLMPEKTEAEQERKRFLYVTIQQMLVAASQAIGRTLAPAFEPSGERARHR